MFKTKSFIIAQIILMALIVSLFLAGEKTTAEPWPFLGAIIIIEIYFILSNILRKNNSRKHADLMILVWSFFLLWEILVTKLNLAHPVLIPAPENVFAVFTTQYKFLGRSVISSLELLLIGTVGGIALGIVFGLAVGWVNRLRELFYPIAQVLAPIPPIVYAPYLIALMPTFRSASALVIFLGIFWPTFLNMIIRVSTIEPKIMDSARALDLNNTTMIKDILIPYLLPGVVSGLKVTLTTSVMLLIFAEMMGATSGMGYYIINYTHYANYTNVVAGIILVGVVVMILNWLVGKIQKHTIKWC